MKKITTAVLAITLVGFGYFLLKDEIDTTIIEANEIVHPSADVINHFGRLTINGYEWIDSDIHWIDEQSILFYGRRAAEEAMTYHLNTVELSLEPYAEDIHRSGVEVLYESHDSIVYVDEEQKSLSIYKDNEQMTVLDNGLYLMEKPVKMSANEDKLGFSTEDADALKVYDTSGKKMKTIGLDRAFTSEDTLLEAMAFSDDGGFLSVSYPGEHLSDRRFSIYGADSGRLYGDAVIGLSPVFSPDNRTLGFIYSGDMTEDYQYGKIGLFVLKHKKITYLDSLTEGELILPILSWSADSQYLYGLVSTGDNYYRLLKIDVLNGNQEGMTFMLERPIRRINDMKVLGNKVYLAYNNGQLCVVDVESGRYNLTKGLLPIDDTSYLKLLDADQVLIHLPGDLKLIGEGYQRNLMSYEGEMMRLYLSPKETSLCILVSNGTEMTLQLTEINQ